MAGAGLGPTGPQDDEGLTQNRGTDGGLVAVLLLCAFTIVYLGYHLILWSLS